MEMQEPWKSRARNTARVMAPPCRTRPIEKKKMGWGRRAPAHLALPEKIITAARSALSRPGSSIPRIE